MELLFIHVLRYINTDYIEVIKKGTYIIQNFEDFFANHHRSSRAFIDKREPNKILSVK